MHKAECDKGVNKYTFATETMPYFSPKEFYLTLKANMM